jgi:hypothetical protein
MKRYIGRRTVVGPCQVLVGVGVISGEYAGKEMTHPVRHFVRHSPTGFQWGYGGSGPADLARSILLDALGEWEKERVERLYQDFKWKFIAPIQGNLEIREEEIMAWVGQIEARLGVRKREL